MTRYVRALCVALSLFTAGIVGSPSLVAAPAQRGSAESSAQGNPSTKVWVNSKSHVYHCPGTRYYGTTKNGSYMTQADAQKGGNRPAYGKYCG